MAVNTYDSTKNGANEGVSKTGLGSRELVFDAGTEVDFDVHGYPKALTALSAGNVEYMAVKNNPANRADEKISVAEGVSPGWRSAVSVRWLGPATTCRVAAIYD